MFHFVLVFMVCVSDFMNEIEEKDERGGVSERTKPIQWNRWYRLSM